MSTKVEQQVECASCTWDKFCLSPPTMTSEEVESRTKPKPPAERAVEGEEKKDSLLGDMLNIMMFSGKDTECRACPQLISRLREGPELSNYIKSFMQES